MRGLTLLIVCLLALPWRPADAAPEQASQPIDTSVVRARDDTRAQRLFGELMSPYCPGLTVAACPSPGADSLRRDIRDRLERGETPRAIRASYAADWGERILGAPPVRDWGVVLWLMPGIVLTLGAVGLTLWLRRRRQPANAEGTGLEASAVAPVPPEGSAIRKRLEEELAAFDYDR